MKWPHFLRRKEILFSPKTPQEELIRWGDRYLEDGRLHDAVDFFRQAHHSDGLQRIRALAVEDGDFFLFREALDGMDSPSADPEEMATLAQHAEKAGRWQDAKKAYERLKDADGLRRAEEALRALKGDQPDEVSSHDHGKGA